MFGHVDINTYYERRFYAIATQKENISKLI
jgi:hypothetical protein